MYLFLVSSRNEIWTYLVTIQDYERWKETLRYRRDFIIFRGEHRLHGFHTLDELILYLEANNLRILGEERICLPWI